MKSLERRPVRFAVVGCGNIGARHLHYIAANPSAQVVALCDIDESVRNKYSAQYGVPGFADYGRMLGEVEADVISVCTPHALHCPMTLAAVETGRHVLVEKPMALTVSDCLRMREAAAARHVHLMLVWQNRHNVPVRLTLEALREGWLGRIFMVHCSVLWNRPQSYYDVSPWRGSREQEGGALFTQCSHFLDLLIQFFGPVEWVSSVGELKDHDIEIEDCGAALLRFESGVLGSLSYTTCVHRKNYEGSIIIVGENGTIKIGGAYLNTLEYWDVKDHPLPPGVEFTDKPNQYAAGYAGTSSNHDKVIADVVSTVTHADKVLRMPGWGDGHSVVKAIEMLYRSQENGGVPITSAEFEADEQALTVWTHKATIGA